MPEPARVTSAPLELGASFSPWRAQALGLDPDQAFAELLAMRFAVIRLAARWDLVDSVGYGELDHLRAWRRPRTSPSSWRWA